ncbi:MAG: hypothetical protein ACFFAE_12250 [Candidatus Hodarchaeota archaeon]
MKVDENWAMFVNLDSEVEWSWGNPDDEFLQFTVNFLQGLSNIGSEIFGENSVASIEFEYTGFKTSEVFIVSLQNKFFFICSDPAITLKLISATEGLPKTMEEHIAAVLVGQAAIIFADSISNTKSEQEMEIIERSFQAIILSINPSLSGNISTICSKASSNFSMLSFNELLSFHYYIRKHETLTDLPTGLALISHLSGGDLPFSWNVERDVVLAGYLAVIFGFIKTLFGGSARRLIFGAQELRKLDFIYGKEYFMAIDSSFTFLCKDPRFLPSFLSVSFDVLRDLGANLKRYIIRETLEHATTMLEELSLRSILEAYQSLSTDPYLSFNDQIRKILQVISSNNQ